MVTYEHMARELGVAYCRGINERGQYCRAGDHRVGFADDAVHLTEPARIDRRDTLTFLKLAALVIDPTLNEDIPWRRVFRRYRVVRDAAARFHMRFPPRHWRADKAFVLAGTAGLPNSVPLRKQAFDWARR